MKLEIKGCDSSAIERVRQWTPADPAKVYFDLTLDIGVEGERGADMFQLIVATPEGLKGHTRLDSRIIQDRALLIVDNYDRDEVFRHLERIVEKCTAATWVESTLKLQRYFAWEYEDYVPG